MTSRLIIRMLRWLLSLETYVNLDRGKNPRTKEDGLVTDVPSQGERTTGREQTQKRSISDWISLFFLILQDLLYLSFYHTSFSLLRVLIVAKQNCPPSPKWRKSLKVTQVVTHSKNILLAHLPSCYSGQKLLLFLWQTLVVIGPFQLDEAHMEEWWNASKPKVL